jgi:hypothetical protein
MRLERQRPGRIRSNIWAHVLNNLLACDRIRQAAVDILDRESSPGGVFANARRTVVSVPGGNGAGHMFLAGP